MIDLTQKLNEKIESALYLWESITLKDLIDFYPVTGLAEIYTYLKIAYDHPRHHITLDQETLIVKGNRPDTEYRITMPIVTFYRQEVLRVVPSQRLSCQLDFSEISQLQVETIALVA